MLFSALGRNHSIVELEQLLLLLNDERVEAPLARGHYHQNYIYPLLQNLIWHLSDHYHGHHYTE